ncbi:polysaccharide deacetylase family protein [Streptosporangium soli]|nr:polysaccharide deacetylase family protein [Streptosporangium sp. KLBMP 9127]
MVTAIVALSVMPTASAPPPPREHGHARQQPAEVARKPVEAPPRWAFPPPVTATAESARKAKANEAGLVPVIMYHRILAKPLSDLDRTPSEVRKELERLARSGYVPITAREFATGEISIPEGSHPVVLTFDDGHPSHFAFDEQGEPAKDTAVDLILDVAEKHPDFRPVATFWVNREPFGLRERSEQSRAASWLAERGFEVANHTWSHHNLGVLSRKRVREQIVRGERLLTKIGLKRSETLALPYGSMPRSRKTARSGSWDGTGYDYKGVFLAGAEPSRAPYDKDFDRSAIQRIQSNGKKGECRKWCSKYWLDWLDDHPKERYTADGDPERISIPEKLRGNIAPKRRRQVNAY